MALALMILSTEGGKDTCTVISATEQEAAEAFSALSKGRRFLGVETETALNFMVRAWEVMGEHYERRELPPNRPQI